MIYVEKCASWHELNTGQGRHCYNCVHRDGYPYRGQPSKACGNFSPLPLKRVLGSAHGCCKHCHEISGDNKCQWCREKPPIPTGGPCVICGSPSWTHGVIGHDYVSPFASSSKK